MTKTNERFLTLRLNAENVGEPDAPQGRLSGMASVYGKPYMGEFGPQQINQGAFAEDIANKNGVIPIFYQHGWAKSANAVPIGHAHVTESAKGAKVDAQLYINELPEAKAVWLAAAAGALNEWSIGFLANETTLLHPKTGKELSAAELVGLQGQAPIERTDKGTLLETSVVVKGANPYTTMTNVAEHQGELEESDEDPVLDEAEVERAWTLLASPHGREILRGARYSDHENVNDPEVNKQ